MSTTNQCRTCGTEVPSSAPFGHCPKCLIDLGFGPLPDDLPANETSDGNQRFGDYELIEQIGRGGMGVVYKARQIRLNRLVAIKMINAGEFASTTLIQRFHREAEAAANLHHPNIVPIYEIGELRGQHFYSMQLVEGTGLDKHISRSGFTRGPASADAQTGPLARQEDIARILAKVARAVDCAHRHGVLHRDLKPGNILLDARGEPHLTDFGVAKVLGHEASNLTASGAIMGTPSFMAPEQAAGDSKHITVAADIYSLGAVLYTMLTGSPPFRAETPVETLKQVIEQEPKHPSTIREGLDFDLATIAMKCLEKEPQRRYASAVALAEDLERWLQDEPIQARPVHNAERLWRWCRRNPKLAAMIASVALLLVGVSIGSTLVALHIQHLNNSVDNFNQRLRDGMLQNLSRLYSDPNTKDYTVKAEDRHAMMGRGIAPSVSGRPLEITFVDYVYGHPTNILTIFAPILEVLEQDLSIALRHPVFIHLRMLQSYDLGYDELETGRMTFGRVGPSSFSQLLDRATGVELVAMQDQTRPLTLALFTLTNSPLSRIMKERPDLGLAGWLAKRSVAFGNSNSTTGNFVARSFLAQNGVFATNLSHHLNHNSHAAVIQAIRAQQFDLGAVNRELIRNQPDLHIVETFEVDDLGRCWVAGRGLPREVFTAIRQSLLRMRDPAIIGGIESELDGFKVVDERVLDRLREIMHGADAFDSRIPQQ